MHSTLISGRLQVAFRYVSLALAAVSLPLSAASISRVTINEVAPAEQQAVSVNVEFDTPVCAPNQTSASDVTRNGTGVLQARVSGNVVSVVLVTSTEPSLCVPTKNMIIALPALPAGSYALRVSTSVNNFAGVLYAYAGLGPVVSATLSVAPALPAPIKVYLYGYPYSTALTIYDSGSYQIFPTYANDEIQWQPVFYAWPWSASQSHPSLKPVYTLASKFAALPTTRYFYTLDKKERDAMVATGTFVDVGTAYPGSSIFAAVASVGGICPMGLTAIYRAYEPRVAIHRYVPDATYQALLANGWNGDGIAFCVAAEPAGASSWTPN